MVSPSKTTPSNKKHTPFQKNSRAQHEQCSQSFIDTNADKNIDVTVLLNEAGAITYAGPSITHLLGYAPEELIGNSFLAFIHPDELGLAQARFNTVLHMCGTSKRAAYRVRRKDGSWQWVEGSCTCVQHAPGIIGVVGHFHTCAEEKLSAPEAPESDTPASEHIVQFYETDEFLTHMLGAYIGAGLRAGEVCIVAATPGHIASLDRQLQAQGFDVPAARLQGSYCTLDATATVPELLVNGELEPGRFAEIVGSRIVEAQQGERGVRVFGELVALMWADGNRAAAIRLEALWNEWLKTNGFMLYCAYPLRLCGGEEYEQEFREVCRQHTQVIPTESYTTLTDLGECLCTVTMLQQKAASLEVEVAVRKATQALERNKDAFISMASHELRTPITSLKCFLALLQRHEAARQDHKALHYIAHMDAQVERVTKLISDLLDLSRMQTGKLTYQLERFAVGPLVQEIVETVQGTAPTHTLILEEPQEREPGHAEVLGDRDHLGQVLINLLTNAVKYSPRASQVIVRVAKTAEQVHVSIQDFGMGIAKEHQQRIFERFYRVNDADAGTYPGLGIGLSICSEIVEWHRGQLWVESEKGAGATFHVTLPLAP